MQDKSKKSNVKDYLIQISLRKHPIMSQPGNCTGYERQGAWQGFGILQLQLCIYNVA